MMPQIKTLHFANSASGQNEKNAALSAHLSMGWTVLSETITQGKFRGGTACCNFLICAPTAFLAGSTDGTINVTLQHSGTPEQLKATPSTWDGGTGTYVVVFIVLMVFVSLFSKNEPKAPPSTAAATTQKPTAKKKTNTLATGPCRIVAHWAAMTTVACPADITNAKILEQGRLIHKAKGMNGISSIYFFNEGWSSIPKSTLEMQNSSDKEFDRMELGQVSFNNNNGYKEFYCKKTPNGKMENCSELLK